MIRRQPTNHLIITLLAAVLLIAAAHAFARQDSQPASTPRTLFAAAATDADWVVRPQKLDASDKAAADKAPTPRWTVLRRPRSTAAPPAWSEVAALDQRPLAIAPFGERLAVLYENNSWALIGSGTQVAGPSPAAGVTLLSLIDGGDRLVFLARAASSEPKHVVLDFDGRALSEPRAAKAADANASGESRFISATANAAFAIDDARLNGYRDVATSSDGRMHAFAGDDDVRVVSLDGADASITLPPAAAGQRLTLSGEADGAARFWWMDGDQFVSLGFKANGDAIGEPAPITMLAPHAPPMFERGLYVVGALTLVLVLFAGGRQMIATGRPPSTKPPPRPAPLARRLAAGIVDAIPLVACVAYLAAGNKLTIYAGMLRFDGGTSEAILTAGVLFYLVLLFAFEVKWQRSIGKAIFALRVVAIDGGKPRPLALLLRNGLRLVDLNLITLLFVPVTPLRQRLGDFLAGTMVIDALDADAKNPARVTPDGRRDNK